MLVFEFCTKIRYRASQDTQDTRCGHSVSRKKIGADCKAKCIVSLPREMVNGNAAEEVRGEATEVLLGFTRG